MLLTSVCVPGTAVIPLKTNGDKGIHISAYDDEYLSFLISVQSPEISFDTAIVNGYSFVTIDVEDEGYLTAVGQAQLPMIRRFIEIPQGAQPTIRVVSQQWESVSIDSMVFPVQPSIKKTDKGARTLTMDTAYYQLDQFLPESIASFSVIGEIRSHRVGLLEITPVQYNPAQNELRILKSCELQLLLPGADRQTTMEKLQRYSSTSFESMINTVIFNDNMFRPSTLPKKSEGFLFIVYDSFVEEIAPLITIKSNKGFDTTVTLTSEIPGGATKENIKTYIQNAYDTWSIPPAYILLVGDTPQVPTYPGTAGPDAADLYFVTVAGTDYFPDIYIGRFPAADESQVTAMVEKTVYYETGSFPSNEWIRKAAFLAGNDNYQISEGTHNFVISTYLEPNGYICDKLYEVSYGATTQDVTNAINNGRSLVIMSGHGSQTSWGDGPPYSQSNVQSLANDGIYPFVCSHSCLTGSFQISECFGETWLRVSHKGGLAFWGASESTYWDEDDILERKMFSAWWDDGLGQLGGMTDMALYYLYQHYGGSGLSKYYYEAYNILGDPSVVLWTDDPNSPPATPNHPTGPTEGLTFIEYTYSAVAPTDPEGEEVFLRFDFDDGTISNWFGPFSPGESVAELHTWKVAGDYAVRVQAKDESGRETAWSESLMVAIADKAKLEILSLEGGIGAGAVVRNTMNEQLTNVLWSLSLKNGLIFVAKQMGGKIAELGGEQQTTVRSGIIIGFGRVDITFYVGDAMKTGSGFMLGPLLLGVQ